MKIALDLTEEENIRPEYKELAIARKLQILMSPYLRRNPDFFYAGANIPKKANAYKTPMDKGTFEENIKKDKNTATVCKPLCDMVVEILRENNIDAQTISCDTDMFKHTDVVIKNEEGKQYIINFLEDIEALQTGMSTPDFASREYYNRRYKKFEGSTTTNGVKLDNIAFISAEDLDNLDNCLEYKKYGLYMNDVIKQIKEEFLNFKSIMSENELLTKEQQMKLKGINQEDIELAKKEIMNKYNNMTDDELLEAKLDWIFNYFNDRYNIKGHTDFVMYYSRMILKEVLTNEEYKKVTRYDCFIPKKNITLAEESMKSILDLDNPESENKARFCILEINGKYYMFSTKANEYLKLESNKIEELKKISIINKSEPPSDLLLKLCDRGNALPLVFHPLGAKMLNDLTNTIPKNLTPEERTKRVQEIADSIKTTDEPITSITIPSKNGEKTIIYINENDEFVVRTGKTEKVYHYNEENDEFNIEER